MTVMPLKLFVNCVGDLATVGGSVLVVTSFRPLPDPSLFVCGAWKTVSLFYSEDSLTLRPSGFSENWWCEPDARGERSLSGHILG
jgi:hypothetical protein